MISYDFTSETYKDLLFDRSYSQPAPGWIDGVYYARKPTIHEHDLNKKNIFECRFLEEDSGSLNGDVATIGHFEYYEGTFLRVATLASNYKLTMTLKNPTNKSVQLDIIVNGLAEKRIELASNELKTVISDVYLTQRSLELTFKPVNDTSEFIKVELDKFSLSPLSIEDSNLPKIYIASDSTAQTYNDQQYPQHGWGQCLYYYLFNNRSAVIENDPNSSYSLSHCYIYNDLTIVNKSIGARSSKSFIKEGKLRELVKTLAPKDYLLIQFGDNDATAIRPLRYVNPTDFIKYIDQYVVSALDRKAIPVLITPPPRYNFIDKQHAKISFNDYRQKLIEYAQEKNIAYIDLGKIGSEYLSQIGSAKSRGLFMKLSYGQYPNFPEGLEDATHFRKLGAMKMAAIVAQQLHEIDSQINYYPVPVLETLPKPSHITAQLVNQKNAEHVLLKWDEVAQADGYIISKNLGRNKTSEILVGENYYNDFPQEGQESEINYLIYAYRDNIVSQPAGIKFNHSFKNLVSMENKILGINLYEIDATTVSDKISFSVRFNPNKKVSKYQVVVFEADNGQQLVLDHFSKDQINDLHSYTINKAADWYVYIKGFSDQDELFQSDNIKIIW